MFNEKKRDVDMTDCKVFDKNGREKMTKNNKLFDLNDVSDLPDNLKRGLKCQKKYTVNDQIIDLFKKAGKPLNLDELQVGYFRLTGKDLPRESMNARVYYLSRASIPVIKRVKGENGVYTLIKAEKGGDDD